MKPTPLDYSAVKRGIRLFVRLVPLRQDVSMRHIQDEFDAELAIETIADHVLETRHLIGKKMYRKTPYNPLTDVKTHLEHWLLIGPDERSTALLRRKHLSLYHLVLEPTVDVLKTLPAEEVPDRVREVVDTVRNMLLTHNDGGTYEDALIARALVTELIKQREAAEKAAKAMKRRRKKVVKEESFEEIEPEPLSL